MKQSIIWTGAAIAAVLATAVAGKQLGWWSAPAPAPKAEQAVAVKIDPVLRADTSVYLDSIATVQAFNSVSVRARVDGQIVAVRFTEGSQVRRGDVLVELDKRPFEVALRAATAQQAKDVAQLPNGKRNLERYEELTRHDAVAPQVLDAARASYDQLRAAVDADQAQIDQARLQLDYATIRAPIDGRVGARLADAGNLVHAGDAGALVTISQIQPVSVSFALPQAMLGVLRDQQRRHALTVLALGHDGQLIERGQLALIDSQVDVATGTIRCKATFANAKETLWPGAFVTARVQLDALPAAVTVATAAIQAGAQRPFVYVVTADGRAQARDIDAGPVSGARTVVLAGLSGGERVVVEGQFQLENGKLLKTTPAPAAAAAQH